MKHDSTDILHRPFICVLQEKAALEAEWRARVAAAEAAAQKSKQATEAKVAAIVDRLHSLAEQESKREQQRGTDPTAFPPHPVVVSGLGFS